MPTEVLSYYLKNKDRKVRLGFQVILQCAPFLKGLKVSGLISMENESYSELEEMFSGMEINFYKLSCSEGKCLVLFYRPKELEEYMNQPKLRELIGQYGYKESNIEEMLTNMYGDFMQLPPVEKRKTHTPSRLEFSKEEIL